MELITMSDVEVLVSYRLLAIEIDTLERQSRFLERYIGGPRPVQSPRVTGMPRGTNDPEAALLQREDTNEILNKLTDKCDQLVVLMGRFETIVDAIRDRRLKIIIRNYYGLGETDEAIAERLELSQSTVNRLRCEYIRKMSQGSGGKR